MPFQWTTWILYWSMFYGAPDATRNDCLPLLRRQDEEINGSPNSLKEQRLCYQFLRDSPTSFPLTAEQIDEQIDQFIQNIDEGAVGQLASRYNGQKPWKIVGRRNGSFNVCFFVQFDDGNIWVVRIPLNPVVDKVWTKCQSEVATIRYLRHKSTIPIPQVRAFGEDTTLTKKGCEPLAFIISDHIAGQTLSIMALQNATKMQRQRFFDELIEVYAQLRQLEFPAAGSLMPNSGRDSEPIIGGLLTIAGNELHRYQSERKNPGPFVSTTDFMNYQYYILWEISRLPSEGLERAQAEEELFALVTLAKQVSALYNSQSPNRPFILSHLDLRCGNIIIDADFSIAGIIDWEFSGTVPLEFFTPPLWITGHGRNGYINLYTDTISNEFYAALRTKATTSNNCAQLMQEWNSQTQFALPIVQILRQPETLLRVFYSFIFRTLFKGDREQVISEFFAQNDHDGALAEEIRHRVENSKNYVQYLREHGLQIIDEEAEKRQEELIAKLRSGIAKLEETYGSNNQSKGCDFALPRIAPEPATPLA